ncbi:hypothetical protein DY000_02003805 [Brassica cretica]|uniref:Protein DETOXIFICATION n=1 Tax=Brassica cretica TaxID=69181 RepID=A0ABQ7BYT4_BRACR|nr:hypothetical protein DY000_02003805 [Brassica cretica]
MTETGDLTSVPASVVTRVFSNDAIGREILGIAFPAALALAADPIASLIDTAYIGRLGAVELAAVGVSIAIFNQASRITIFPIVSVTTSFVAEEDTMEKIKEEEKEAKKNNLVHANTLAVQDSLEKGIASPTSNNMNQPQQTPASDTKSSSGNKANKKGKKNIKSASTAMIIGLILGLVQAIFLIFSSKVLLGVMGVKPNSAVLSPAHKYLTIRSLGAPALLLSLSMQGIFRGFKDTKTPLYATIVADVINIILDPIFIFVLHLGVSGAAIAHVISQGTIAGKDHSCDVLSDTSSSNGGSARNNTNGCISNLFTSLVNYVPPGRWSCCSRSGDSGLFFCREGRQQSVFVCIPCSTGLGLSVFVGLGLYFGAGIFTKDPAVIHLIAIGIPFVAATQPINSLAFVLDGVNFGASDFACTAYSMVGVAAISIAAIIYMAKFNGFLGIWIALTIYMGLRAITGIAR